MQFEDNVTILWDIENVTPKSDSLFVEGLIEFAEENGKLAFQSAYGDWNKTNLRKIADILADKGFELIHVPRSKKNSADISLITHATEMIFQYPHINRYILLTGDADFRPLLLTLRKHGKDILIICDSNNASEDLLSLADEFVDYRNLMTDTEVDDVFYHDYEPPQESVGAVNRETAFKLLVESIKLMDREKKIPTPGSVKVRMKLLNENFNETMLGYKQWKHFINDAMAAGYIKKHENENGITLTLASRVNREISDQDAPEIVVLLLQVIKELDGKRRWVNFSRVSEKLIEKSIDIKSFGYSKLKKLIIDAEKRHLVETKNDSMKWYVKLY